MTGTIASPVAQWPETPSSGAARTLTRLTPYLGTDGVWVLVGVGQTPPVGATAGVWLTDSNGVTVPTQAASIGQKLTAGPTGFVFVYGQPQLFRYAVGGSLAFATFSRADTANYVGQSTEPAFSYQVGGSLAAATFTRGTTATYTGDV